MIEGTEGIEFLVVFSESPGFDVHLIDEMRVSRSYRDLEDKPTLNGNTIDGDMRETDPTVPNWAKDPSPPKYTAKDVGAIPEDAVLGESDLEYMWDTIEGGGMLPPENVLTVSDLENLWHDNET